MAQQQRPNILYIMCDDMGYGDLSCYGQQHFRTPNIDRLAQQGMRMTSAYAGSPVSAPSRACFMTGQHSGHTHVRGNKEYWSGRVEYGQNVDYAVVGQEPYDTAHVILPEIFKAAGYRTGMFGKWAGGYEGSISTPDKRGVDEFYGYICQFQAHLYFPNFLNRFSRSRGDKGVVREVLEQNIQHAMFGDDYNNRRQYSADLIHQRALEWLRQQEQGKPFFGIFTYTLPHAELRQPDDSLLQAFRGKLLPERTYRGDNPSRYNPTPEAHAQFAAMITRLDAQVGEIMQLLEERGLAQNTVLIFTSDNGPHEEGGADPDYFNHDEKFRGLKRSTHEGGIRIPFIVRWPGHISAGSESDQPFAFYDLLPTFCDIAGIDNMNVKRPNLSTVPLRFYRQNPSIINGFDGISILPTLTGKGVQPQHDHLYWEFHETDMLGVRRGNWKLVVRRGQCALYNLAADPHEDNDLAAQYPDTVNLLVQKIYEDHTDSPLFPVTLPKRPRRPQREAFTTETPMVHDPVMAKDGDTYYIYSTGMGIQQMTSKDRRSWTVLPQPLMSVIPGWTTDSVPGFNSHVWAPDVIRWHGRWWLAYSCSTFGKNGSAIGLLSTRSLRSGIWKDEGCIIASREKRDNWNAIDPNFVIDDATDTPWMTWGSFWDGIQLIRLDSTMHVARGAKPRTIARRYPPGYKPSEPNPTSKFAGTNAIEAPFIFKHGGYYYLFVSWDYCCRGAKSNYRVAVGRSKNIEGPYLDRIGRDMSLGGGTLFLEGDKQEWEATGHCAAYNIDGEDIFICHGYSATRNGAAFLIQRPITWTSDGWPELK